MGTINGQVTITGVISGTPSITGDGSVGGGGSAPLNNESMASVLVNAASPGDAGNRSDHFNDLSKWTSRILPSSFSAGMSSLGFLPKLNMSAFWTQQYSPSGAFRIEARVGSTSQTISSLIDGHGPWFFVSDSGLQNGNLVYMEANRGALLSRVVSGVYSPTAYIDIFSPVVANNHPQTSNPFWMYIRLDRDATNNFTGYVSIDRSLWIAVGTLNFGLSVTYLGIGGYQSDGYHFFDFIDIVS